MGRSSGRASSQSIRTGSIARVGGASVVMSGASASSGGSFATVANQPQVLEYEYTTSPTAAAFAFLGAMWKPMGALYVRVFDVLADDWHSAGKGPMPATGFANEYDWGDDTDKDFNWTLEAEKEYVLFWRIVLADPASILGWDDTVWRAFTDATLGAFTMPAALGESGGGRKLWPAIAW